MAEPEGHVEGQEPPVPDPTDGGDGAATATMTEEEINQKIEDDTDFANKVASGEIDVTKPITKEPAEEPKPKVDVEGDGTPPPEPDTPTPAEKPDGGEKPPVAEPPKEEPPKETPPKEEPPKTPAEDKEFKVKQSELGGYKTPGEAVKATVEKEGHIGFLGQRIDALKDKGIEDKAEIERLQAELAKKTAAPPQPPKDKTDGTPPKDPEKALEAPAPEGDIEDPYDPEYLKKIGKTAGQINEIMTMVKNLEAKVTSQEQKGEQKERVASEFRDLNSFQKVHPEFQTKDTFEVMDAQYRKFIENIGFVAKTDGSFKQNMAAVNIYMGDKTERGENLRKAAETNGVQLFDDFEKYNAILTYRYYSGQYHKKDPDTGKMVPFTLEETFDYLNRDKKGGTKPGEGGEPPTPAPTDDSEKNRKIAEEAEKRKKEFATDVPPEMSGAAESVDNMSEDEQAAMLDTPDSELRNNPAKLKIVNEIYRRLGQPPLNVNGLQ